ncbi:hypothetical protein [Streptomyces sp. NPDC005799]|uniref:hypothetical protein n=1 Tax=Streptomyces sp. NPDC005799 TaxID=3154678 RepID=UPI00340D7C5D
MALTAAALVGVTAAQAQASSWTRTGPVRATEAQAETDDLQMRRSCKGDDVSSRIDEVNGGYQAVVACTDN